MNVVGLVALAHIIYVMLLVHAVLYFKFPAKCTGRYHGKDTALGRYHGNYTAQLVAMIPPN